MRLLIGALLLAVVLAGCGGSSPASPPSGVQGIVLVSPTCPVERLNSPCPPRPIAVTIVVDDSQGTEVARGQSGGDGRFKIDVRPGTYTLSGLNVNHSPLPRPIPKTITVAQGSYTNVTLEYDSGIR